MVSGAQRARLFAAGVVRDERVEPDGTLLLLVDLPAAELADLRVLESEACAGSGAYLEFTPPPPTAAARR